MQCPKCNKVIADGSKYCVYCGTDTSTEKVYDRTMYNNPQSVKTYLTEAILVTLFCCQIGGIVAIVYAANASSAVSRGDYNEAVRNSASAQTWVNISFFVGIGVGVLYLLLGIAGGR